MPGQILNILNQNVHWRFPDTFNEWNYLKSIALETISESSKEEEASVNHLCDVFYKVPEYPVSWVVSLPLLAALCDVIS